MAQRAGFPREPEPLAGDLLRLAAPSRRSRAWPSLRRRMARVRVGLARGRTDTEQRSGGVPQLVDGDRAGGRQDEVLVAADVAPGGVAGRGP
jgi:hypothetical protein